MKTIRSTLAAALVLTLAGGPAFAAGADLPEPKTTIIAQGLSAEKAETQLEAARTYYAFWNTGDEALAKKALAEDFMDLNLPEGRPQGPTGPLVASEGFRKAVPDLSMTVGDVFVLDGKVIGQLHFSGHFTGTFGDIKGEGQPISFVAVDMYTIEDGKITENWHLEDNLTLMQQLGIVGAE